MPNPGDFKSKDEFMKVCVPMRIKEGSEQDQAVAACSGMWEKHDKGEMMSVQPESEELIFFGDTIKATGEGRIGGYLIRYSGSSDPDLTGDFFDAKSNIHIPADIPLLYNHGMDKHFKKAIIGEILSIKMDAVGAWVDSQLNMRDEYEKAVFEMAKAGKLGYSSGALSHLVEREPEGKAMHIKTWFVGEASLTVRPAEFRNSVMPLKSLNTSEQAALTDTDAQIAPKVTKEIKTMDENEVNAAAKKAAAEEFARLQAEQKSLQEAETAKQAELKAAEEKGYKAAIEDVKGNKAPAFLSIMTDDTADNKNGGVTAFKHWLKTGQENSELIVPGGPMDKWGFGNSKAPSGMKAAFNVTTGGSGAFLVPDLLYSQIQPVRDLASFIRQAPHQHFQVVADHLLIPATDTKSVAFTLTAEAASYTEDEATVKQVDLKLYKFTKMVKMNEEFVMYNQTNFDAWLVQDLARAEAVTENTLYATGAGGTTIEGVTTNATAGNTVATSAVIAPSDLTALVGSLGGGYNVQGQTGFLMTNATKWYIKGIGTSTFPWFAPLPMTGPSTNNQGPIGDPGFLGYPVFLSDAVGAYTSTSATAKSVTYGNWNFYAMGERPGMLIQRNPYLYMATGQIGLFCSIFRGGIPIQTEAFYYLVQKS
jgi:HK97 family phage major capsid protein